LDSEWVDSRRDNAADMSEQADCLMTNDQFASERGDSTLGRVSVFFAESGGTHEYKSNIFNNLALAEREGFEL
jgi:hypothetical protein